MHVIGIDKEIMGEGPILFAVNIIDVEDPEDSSAELWFANDEDHLYDQVRTTSAKIISIPN